MHLTSRNSKHARQSWVEEGTGIERNRKLKILFDWNHC